MTDARAIAALRTLIDGAGTRVFLPPQLLGEVASLARWYGYATGITFVNGTRVEILLLSDAREMLSRAEQAFVDKIHEALS